MKIFESKVLLASWKINYIEKNDDKMREEIIELFKRKEKV